MANTSYTTSSFIIFLHFQSTFCHRTFVSMRNAKTTQNGNCIHNDILSNTALSRPFNFHRKTRIFRLYDVHRILMRKITVCLHFFPPRLHLLLDLTTKCKQCFRTQWLQMRFCSTHKEEVQRQNYWHECSTKVKNEAKKKKNERNFFSMNQKKD